MNINLSIQEVVAIIGNKELIIFTKDKEIEILQARIKELTDKYEPKPVEPKKPELVK